MFSLFGLIGSICFAISSWPQVYYTIKTHDTKSVSLSFIVIFLIGAFSFTLYALMTRQFVLLPNYLFCFLGFFIILIYKLKNKVKGRQ